MGQSWEEFDDTALGKLKVLRGVELEGPQRSFSLVVLKLEAHRVVLEGFLGPIPEILMEKIMN